MTREKQGEAVSRLQKLAKEMTMAAKKKTNAASRLHELAEELKKAYPKVAKNLAKALEPVEAAIAEIDETFRPTHYAEALLNGGSDGERSAACFARDMYSDGDEAEYLLCATRGPDNKCCLSASVCKFSVASSEETDKKAGKNGVSEVTIRKTLLVKPEKLAIRLRANIIDALDGFADAYEEHVREARKNLFDGSDAKAEAKPSAAPEEKAPDPILEAPEEESEPKETAQPAPKSETKPLSKSEQAPETKKEEEIEDPLADMKDRELEAAVTSPDIDLPTEAWIPTSR